MDHEQFLQRINAALDERRPLDTDAELAELAGDDAWRRELLASYRLLQSACPPRLEKRVEERIPGLADRVLAQLRAEGAPAIAELAHAEAVPSADVVRQRWLAVAAVLSMAAALAVAFLPAFMSAPPDTLAVNPPAVNHPKQLANPNTQVVVAPPVAEKPLDELFREAGDRYRELATDTRESFAEVAVLLPQFESRAAVPSAGDRKHFVDRVGDGLKPVTRSVGGALDFLLEALPSGDSG